jgi:hypothetical protein
VAQVRVSQVRVAVTTKPSPTVQLAMVPVERRRAVSTVFGEKLAERQLRHLNRDLPPQERLLDAKAP